MWASVIAVVGTLSGVGLTLLTQTRQERTARREQVLEARRSEMVDAVSALAVALAEHRRVTWVAETTRLSGTADTAAVEATHETWSEVTMPLMRVKILAAWAVPAAEEVTDAIWEMRNATDLGGLELRRDEAGTALTRLVEAASSRFALPEETS